MHLSPLTLLSFYPSLGKDFAPSSKPVDHRIIFANPCFMILHFSFRILTLSKNNSSLSNCPVLSTPKMK